MVFRANVQNSSDVNFEWVSTADFLLKLRLALEREVTNINVVLQREGELAVRENSILG